MGPFGISAPRFLTRYIAEVIERPRPVYAFCGKLQDVPFMLLGAQSITAEPATEFGKARDLLFRLAVIGRCVIMPTGDLFKPPWRVDVAGPMGQRIREVHIKLLVERTDLTRAPIVKLRLRYDEHLSNGNTSQLTFNEVTMTELRVFASIKAKLLEAGKT